MTQVVFCDCFVSSDDPQQHSYIDEQLCNEPKNSSLGQEEPDLPPIKEEQDGPEPPQITEDRVQQEADAIMVSVVEGTSVHQESLVSQNYVREFISRGLTAVAVEIFTVFQQTIVQYQQEIDAQHRLLDITLKPQIKLHRIGM